NSELTIPRSYSTMTDAFFFFSSRRRHTRFSRDWSSDVCSSDLGEFASMQADVNPRIEAMQEAHHAHVLFVISHRDSSIFGHYEVDAHHAHFGGGDFKAEQRLRKHLLFRKASQHLINIADLNFAGGSLLRLTAMFTPAAQTFGVIKFGAGDSDLVAQSGREQIIAKPAQVLTPANNFGDGRGVAEIQ